MVALKSENKHLSAHHTDGVSLITRSEIMAGVLDMAHRIAPSEAAVLIQGESGTGKELLARYIHQNSCRCDGPLVAMNCAALPEQLAESELFGYEKGAFTGAAQSKAGRFERANGGTLLLDEISEMQLVLQAKLLRALQEKQIDPVGGRGPVDVDVRIIATTNRDLYTMVHKGEFREDLYYRLRVIPLEIPPLRRRREDIPALIDFFVEKYGAGQSPRDMAFHPSAMEMLLGWHWPGNVRELENTVHRALLMRSGPAIMPQDLYLETPTQDRTAAKDELVGMTVKELEKQLIQQTLTHVNQNRTKAAEMLGISIRTLRNKLNELAASIS